MTYKELTEILQEQSEDIGIHYMCKFLANKSEAIPIILKILENERELKKELLLDTNVELGRLYVMSSNKEMDLEYALSCVRKYYYKWKDYISCCFNIQKASKEEMKEVDEKILNHRI